MFGQMYGKKLVSILLTIAFVFSLALPAWALEVDSRTENRIRELVDENYFRELDSELVYEAPLEELMEALDRNSGYMTPEEFEEFTFRIDQRFGGIGVQVATRDGRVVITNVLPDTPADQVGLSEGDKIRSIDGRNVTGAGQEEIVKLLRGEEDTAVLLEVDRGDRQKVFNISRAVIDIGEKEARLDRDGIGYFHFDTFSYDLDNWFLGHVRKQTMEGMEGMILDLRGNTGGRVDTGLGVASALLGRNETIMRLFSRDEELTHFESESPGFEGPIVVLTDELSASAAEFVTAALKDHSRAVQVGTQTIGKGRVQSSYELPDGGRLQITTAEYRGPAGTIIDGKGLEPDYRIEDPDEQLEFAYRYLQERVRAFTTLALVPGENTLLVDDREKQMPAASRVEQDNLLVPLRFFAETMGMEVEWNPDGSVTVTDGRDRLELQAGSDTAYWNGTEVPLPLPFNISDGTAYIPLRFFAQSFTYEVNYDAESREITVTR